MSASQTLSFNVGFANLSFKPFIPVSFTLHNNCTFTTLVKVKVIEQGEDALCMPCMHLAAVMERCHSFLTTTLDGGERSACSPDRFTLEGKNTQCLKSVFFWDFTQRWMGRLSPTFRNNLSAPIFQWSNSQREMPKRQAWPLKIRPIGSPEMSVTKYHFMLRNIPGECRCQVQAKLWTVTDVGNDGGHTDFFVCWVTAVTWAQPGRTLSLAFGQRLKCRCPCTDCTAAHPSYDITCKWMLQSVHTTLC